MWNELPRVAFQGSLGFGGLGTVTRELPHRLAAYASITIFDIGQPFVKRAESSPIGRLGIHGERKLKNLPISLLFHALSFRDFDLVHVNYALLGSAATLCNGLCRIPYVFTVHGIPQPEYEEGYDKLGYLAEKWALPLTSARASVVVADSEYIRSELQARFSTKSIVIPLGVDTQRFAPANREEITSIRRKIGISEMDRVVLYAGRLHPWKDPLVLVHAAKHVLKQIPNAIFYLVGRGPLQTDIRETIRTLGIKDRVSVVTEADYYNGLTDYYKIADVFVLPTRQEGFGLVILEAMSCGLPVVASYQGAAPELVGDCGVLFRPGDPYSLSESIVSLLSNAPLRARLREQARTRVVEKFDWDHCAKSYLRVYSQALRED